MKRVILILTLFATITLYAKPITTKIVVKGECEMCKEKIEKALDIPGISFAEWNQESKVLTVRYNDSKLTEDKIHSIISNIGYATDKVAANKEAQDKLDKCCKPQKKGCCAGKEKSSCK